MSENRFQHKKTNLMVFLSPSQLAAVWISNQGTNPKVKSRWEASIPQDQSVETHLDSFIKRVRTALPPKVSRTLLVVSAHGALFRNFELPFANKSKTAAVIPSEMTHLAPQHSASGDLISAVLTQINASQSKTFVSAAAFPAGRFQKWVQLFKDHQLKLQSISLAPINWGLLALNQKEAPKEGWVIHATDHLYTVMAVCNGTIRLVRTTPFDNDPVRAVDEHLPSFLKHTHLAMEAHGLPDFNPKFLCCNAQDPSPFQKLAADLGLKHVPLSPTGFSDPTDSTWDSSRDSLGGQLDSEMALAFYLYQHTEKPLDFISSVEALTPFCKRHHKALKLTTGLATCILLMILGRLLISNQNMTTQLKNMAIKPRVGFSKTDIEQVLPTPAALSVLNQQMVLPRSLAAQPLFMQAIHQMTRVAPNNHSIQFLRLNYRPPHLSIDGEAQDFKTIEQFQKGLTETGLFRSVHISFARAINGRQKVGFGLALEISESVEKTPFEAETIATGPS